ncbi:MAG: ATP-dependent Clp protease proteolytic subunit [Flavobacterium sp.]|nr:ATP-dependent Clp protease proteolytic subunit [Flavobacterium sp.]
MDNKKTVYINFFDSIDTTKVNKFIQFTTEVINAHNPTELYFFIASNGGDVDSGFVLYNFLVSLQSKLTITMHNTGTIDSIANVIFVAGQNRYAAPNSSFLFHGVSMNLQGGVSRTILKESLSRLEGMENRIAHTVSKHSKLSETELTSLFQQGEGKDVNFALSKEIIKEIKVPSVPQGSIHLAMTFV